ncbi:MAG: MarR family transcriptional regulator [Acutalibacteraceae bacterium]|nr:hypothetical protein [Clostridia bacterium]MEE1144168.1 MarR family transcriptional regulator [Acutalibacteraceae bacterium]
MIDRFEDYTSNISQANKYITKIKAHKMKEYGLCASHVNCLLNIEKSDNGLTAVELSQLCKVDKGAISKTLAKLKNEGMIIAGDNGKVYKIKYFITDKGREVCKSINDIIVKIVSECSINLNEDERTKFYETLSEIVKKLENCLKRLESEQ